MQPTERRGIIDSLSAGFGIVTRRPLLLALPVLMDVLLWLGPGISVKPLVRAATSWLTGTLAASPISPDQLAAFQTNAEETARSVEKINLLGILGWQVPTLLGLGSRGEKDTLLLTVSQGGGLALALAALAVVAVLLACLYLGPTAQLVRQRPFDSGAFARSLPLSWARLASYLLLVIAGAVGLGIALLLLLALASIVGGGVVLVGGLALGVALTASVYLFLAKAAIFVDGRGPVQAIMHSARIARQSFWSVLGLFLLVNLITQGMSVIWRVLAPSSVGLVASIVGNAYIATGLTAAVMVYYWDRSTPSQQRRMPAL